MLFVAFVADPRLRDLGGLYAQVEVDDGDLRQASGSRTVAIRGLSGGRVTHVPLEVYVARVLAGEGEPNAPEATQQALAIAIRTYAVANAGRHRRDGFDLCDTTHCQVPRSANDSSRRAALATAGQILIYEGAPADIFYSASCGGHSESAAVVWPGTDAPYLRSVEDDVHDDDEPWTLELPVADVQRLLRGSGFAGSLQDVRIVARRDSGRVATLQLRGLRPDVISGEQFRNVVGPAVLRSTAFSLSRDGQMLRLRGTGYGHGVGMCVIGAGRRARRGESVTAILAHYYPGLTLSTVDGAPVAAAARRAVAPDAGRAGRDVAGSGMAAIQRLAAEAHASLSAVLGVAAPPASVVIHETINDFRAATDRPWWVSAVVRGTAIDVAPPAVLAQRGGVETAVRRAVAEMLIAPALAGRPAWVRVGAARYFTRTPGTPDVPPAGRVACPTDAELTLALSAAAQREAEARAEACFARAYARDRDWRAVR